MREARPSARSRPLILEGIGAHSLPRTLNWKRGNAGDALPADLLDLATRSARSLDFESPALGASATALGQPRSADTSSGHRDRHGTRPTEQGSPGRVPSGWRPAKGRTGIASVRPTGRTNYISQKPPRSSLLQGWLRPRAAGRGAATANRRIQAPSLGGRLGAFSNTEEVKRIDSNSAKQGGWALTLNYFDSCFPMAEVLI